MSSDPQNHVLKPAHPVTPDRPLRASLTLEVPSFPGGFGLTGGSGARREHSENEVRLWCVAGSDVVQSRSRPIPSAASAPAVTQPPGPGRLIGPTCRPGQGQAGPAGDDRADTESVK